MPVRTDSGSGDRDIKRTRPSEGVLRRHLTALLVAAICFQPAAAVQAGRTPWQAHDDSGRLVALPAPPQRIVALAPHVAELLFAAGVGERIVGTTEFADYPPQAAVIPRVARAHSVDLERIAGLKPDLIVVWGSGYSPAVLDALQRLQVPVYISEPGDLESIATSLERLAHLTGGTAGDAAAAQFRHRIAALRDRHAGRSPVRVFYQVWSDPLMTLSGRHVVNEAIRICGGRNIFESLKPLAPQVSVEAVVAADPQAIVATDTEGQSAAGLQMWKRFASISAVRNGHLITLDGSRINRHTPRMAEEIAVLCERLEAARSR